MFGSRFDEIVEQRRREADAFYQAITPAEVGEDAAKVMRQALAGMLWSKQFFFLDADKWLEEHGVDGLRPSPQVAQSGMVPHDRGSCDLDARQMGMSLVRRRGTWPSMRSRCRAWTSISPSSRSIFCSTTPIRIRPDSFPPTSGTSAMSIRRACLARQSLEWRG